jgi:hypothetical protein
MASKSLLVALWVLGTAVAAAVAWQSLRLVGTRNDDVAVGTIPVTASAPVTSAPGDQDPDPEPGDGAGTTTTAVTTTAAPVDDLDVQEQTFDLTGGSTRVRFGADAVEVLWATPQPGYAARIEDEGGGVTKVEFRAGEARSRIDLWWDDGPQFRQREE